MADPEAPRTPSDRSLLHIAEQLIGRTEDISALSLAELDDLKNVLLRFLELEKRRQKAVQSQVAYQQKRLGRDSKFAEKKRISNTERFAERYQSDPGFRQQFLEKKRQRYRQRPNDVVVQIEAQ